MAKKKRIPHKFLPWIDARRKFHLSNAHIQMARELGLSPKRFDSYANTTNQPWKSPLPVFIENLYEEQFGKRCPEEVHSIEELAAQHLAKREARKLRDRQDKQDDEADEADGSVPPNHDEQPAQSDDSEPIVGPPEP